MAIDPSIALNVQPINIESPLNRLSKVMQLQNMQQQGEMHGLQLQQTRQGIDRQNRLMTLLGGFTPDMTSDQQAAALMRGGHLSEAQAVTKTAADVAKMRRDAGKEQIENALKKLEIGGQILSSVQDDQSYQLARQTASQAGFGSWPEAYNQSWVSQQVQQGKELKLRAEEEWRKRSDETTRRGQDMTDARMRDRADHGRNTAPSGYRYNASGDLEPIPGGPADAKARAIENKLAEGSTDVDVSIGTLRDAYDRLEKDGGITSTEKGGLSNLAASISSSGPGQVAGRAFGTRNQSSRNDIAMARPALLAALMKATGMSAKQMDSNAELKLWLSTATDPTLDVESNRKALENIERKYLKKSNGTPAMASQQASGQDHQEALDWANANPNDPRATKIKERLGVK